MDNITHGLTGWAIVRSLPESWRGRWAVPAGVIAGNLPDFEALFVWPTDKPFYLVQHRAWSHSLIGILLEVMAMVGVLAWMSRREKWKGGFDGFSVKRAAIVVGLGALSHLFLDWWNTYGIRPFYPFDETWYYGDMVFIIDPWVWMILAGGLLCGTHSFARSVVGLWAVVGVLASGILTAAAAMGFVPVEAVALWLAMMIGLVLLRRRGIVLSHAHHLAWGLLIAYVSAMGMISAYTAELARDELRAEKAETESSNPMPGVPWHRTVLVETQDAVHRFEFDKRGLRKLDAIDPHREWIDEFRLEDRREVRAWRVFARHPVVRQVGKDLILGDARYQLGNRPDWSELRVRLPD